MLYHLRSPSCLLDNRGQQDKLFMLFDARTGLRPCSAGFACLYDDSSFGQGSHGYVALRKVEALCLDWLMIIAVDGHLANKEMLRSYLLLQVFIFLWTIPINRRANNANYFAFRAVLATTVSIPAASPSTTVKSYRTSAAAIRYAARSPRSLGWRVPTTEMHLDCVRLISPR